jgi:hypothetical protein
VHSQSRVAAISLQAHEYAQSINLPCNLTLTHPPTGQRYDVIIHANATTSNYWMRVGTGGGTCDGPNANAANIRSIFRYAGAASDEPNSTAAAPLPTGCYDESVTPYVKTTVPQKLPEEMKVGFTNTAGSGNLVQWLVNDSPMLIDLAYPTLQHIIDGNDTFDSQRNVFKVGEKDQVRTSSSHACMTTDVLHSGNTGSFNKTPSSMGPPLLIPFTSTAMTSTSLIRLPTPSGLVMFPGSKLIIQFVATRLLCRRQGTSCLPLSRTMSGSG